VGVEEFLQKLNIFVVDRDESICLVFGVHNNDVMYFLLISFFDISNPLTAPSALGGIRKL